MVNAQPFQSSSAHFLSILRDSSKEMPTPFTQQYRSWMTLKRGFQHGPLVADLHGSNDLAVFSRRAFA